MAEMFLTALKLWPFWLLGGIAALFLWLANRPSRHSDGDNSDAVAKYGWLHSRQDGQDDLGSSSEGAGGND